MSETDFLFMPLYMLKAKIRGNLYNHKVLFEAARFTASAISSEAAKFVFPWEKKKTRRIVNKSEMQFKAKLALERYRKIATF